MTDWQPMDIPTFDRLVGENDPRDTVSLGVLDRLPFTFESKNQYLKWRDELGADLGLDGRDISLVGSAASGRSLSSRKRFGVFDNKSDIDIAVVSPHHFDVAWRWFQKTNPNLITGLDDRGRDLFLQHGKKYIYQGMVATDYFLSYLPFGTSWLEALQRSERHLPDQLRGRIMRLRIYRESAALRAAQTEAVRIYKLTVDNKNANKAAQPEESHP